MIVNPTDYNWEFFNSNGVQIGTLMEDLTTTIYRIQGKTLGSFVYFYDIDTVDELIEGGGLYLTIGCFGDSLTFGTGSTSGNTYPELLTKENGIPTFNAGVPGDTSTMIKTRFLAEDSKYKQATIIWAGRNNYFEPETVKADIAEMVGDLAGRPFIVVSILNGDYVSEREGGVDYGRIITLNNDLKALYPESYVDLRKFLVNLYNPAIPKDVSDFGMDLVPESLRSDQIHLNDLGYRKTADFLQRHISRILGDGTLSPNSIHSNGSRVFGNQLGLPIYGSSVETFLSAAEGYVGAYDRTNSVPLPLNIQDFEDAVTNINRSGGTLNIGADTTSFGGKLVTSPPVYSTGGFKTVVVNNATNTIEQIVMPTPGLSEVLTSNNTTGMAIKVGNLEAGVSDSAAGVVAGTIDATTAYIQARDADENKVLAFYGIRFDFGAAARVSVNDGTPTGVVRNEDTYAENAAATPPSASDLTTAYGTKPNGFRVFYPALDMQFTKRISGWYRTDTITVT